TILLGELLRARGLPFDVLTRGYGRSTSGVAVVDPAGSPRQYGDEPLLMARRLETPVIVGEDRYEAGLVAERKHGPRIHLLDDGFQHRQLHRDFDIVLVTPEDARDRLLPAGRLREPLSSLTRADAVVLASGADFAMLPSAAGKLVWRSRRGILPRTVPPQPVAFCGIARPQNFFAQLRTAGIDTAAEAVFRDHHAYTASDIQQLLDLRQRSGAGGFVTTEKDAINLEGFLSKLEPLAVVPVRMQLENAGQAIDAMLDTLRHRGKRVP
ncbi:MAG: tetraacyldisaccharide 4'-kinase, partial [Candidatus Korobacteraceae bacterium]